MFSTLVFKKKESTVTERKFKPPPLLSIWGRTQTSRESVAANAAGNTGGIQKGSHHSKCERSPTESQPCR